MTSSIALFVRRMWYRSPRWMQYHLNLRLYQSETYETMHNYNGISRAIIDLLDLLNLAYLAIAATWQLPGRMLNQVVQLQLYSEYMLEVDGVLLRRFAASDLESKQNGMVRIGKMFRYTWVAYLQEYNFWLIIMLLFYWVSWLKVNVHMGCNKAIDNI